MARNQAQIAASQLAKKLKLEARFKPILMRYFRQLGKDIAIVWAATRNIPTLRQFEPELIAILRQHYRRVARVFDATARTESSHCLLDLDTKQVAEEVDNDVMKFILAHSTTQAGIILNTTEKELQRIAANVLLGSAIAEEQLSQIQIGREVQKRFVDKTGARVNTIAITETQTTSEAIKFIEAGALATLVNQAVTPQILVKTWNTTLDERTRTSHVAADRQEVLNKRAFRVQEQLLRFPGDTCLGASLDNVINCRCSSIVSVQGSDAPIALDPADSLISTRLN